MSVRKRTWRTRAGEHREGWVAAYAVNGKRHTKTFARKRDADRYHASVNIDVAKGIHTPESRSLTVAQAAAQWLAAAELEALERSTLVQYRVHVGKYIVALIGAAKLATLTTPAVNDFRDALLHNLNRATARKVLWSFKAIIKDARRRGTIAHNVAEGVSIKGDKRDKKKLEIGHDIPVPDEVRRILAAAQGSWRALLAVAAFTGLRASELRGLRWSDVELTTGTVHVRQRADQWGVIGRPKTSTSTRAIPVGPFVCNVLKEWRLVCPNSPGNLVFPGDEGRPLTHGTIMYLGYWPAQRAADVVDEHGKPKYTGIHAMRHFFASWLINRRRFPRGDDSEELAAAERTLLTPVATNPK